MKTIESYNLNLKNFFNYQEAIQKSNLGDNVQLEILQKPNGYKDVFVKNNGEIIGEVFSEDSDDLKIHINHPQHFSIDAKIVKFLEKDNNQKSVIVDIDINTSDDFDYDDFMENYEEDEY
ncbi:MAG: hypothetical protein LBE36_06300 [Flavobacteriaceae bacterium]|jgi:hypothetical protein|nr:hypothetical protein [Flavobacteriaceae bacterium]